MFKTLLFTLLFSVLLLAQNPKIYAALGDVIYDNAPKIYALKDTEILKEFSPKLRQYMKEVEKTKEMGFALERGEKNVDKKQYLSALRKLSRDNDMFLRLIRKGYDDAKDKGKSKLFDTIINSGIIDVNSSKEDILEYYFAHREDFNETKGVIKTFLDEDAALKAKKEAEFRKRKTKKELELEKIKRIRERDRREQEALEKRLQQELLEKKRKLREEQKSELTKTI